MNKADASHELRQLTSHNDGANAAKMTIPAQNGWKTWSYELLTASVSIVSFFGLVIALRSFDQQPQQNWKYDYFTRNTIIASIATITRTSLLAIGAISLSQNKWSWFSASHRYSRKLEELETFDNASRGVVGSVQLLRIVKHNHIASLGALVTIMSLGLDTFAQNVLGVKYHAELHTGPQSVGIIPRSEIFNTFSPIQDYFSVGLNLDMKAAISNGILGGSASTISPFCSTGNCTWPATPSLGMCGACTNVTTNLKTSGNCTGSKFCQYSLPDGASLSGPRAGLTLAAFSHAPLSLFNVSFTSGDIYNSWKGNGTGNLSRFYAAQFSIIQTSISDLLSDELAATECALWYCVRAHNITVKSGLQDQATVGTWDLATPEVLVQGLDGELSRMRNFTNVPEEFRPRPDTVFGAGTHLATAINSSFIEKLSGNVSWNGHWGTFQYSSTEIQSLWTVRKDLDSWIKNIAAGMTTVIRTNGTVADPVDSGSRYAGTATSTRAYIHVRWGWLAYPATMLVVGVAHLTTTVWQNTTGRMPAWKGGPMIPLMLTVKNEEGGCYGS